MTNSLIYDKGTSQVFDSVGNANLAQILAGQFSCNLTFYFPIYQVNG